MVQELAVSNKIQVRHINGKKWSSIIPERVREVIVSECDVYTKSIKVHLVPVGYKFYAGEGFTYRVIQGEEVRGVEMVSEHSLGAMNVNHNIGTEFSPVLGSWIVVRRFFYRLGYIVDAYHVTKDTKLLEGKNNDRN